MRESSSGTALFTHSNIARRASSSSERSTTKRTEVAPIPEQLYCLVTGGPIEPSPVQEYCLIVLTEFGRSLLSRMQIPVATQNRVFVCAQKRWEVVETFFADDLICMV
jgi:hypothetical protein